MKKVIAILAGALLISAAAVNAQDTTNTQTPVPPATPTPQPTTPARQTDQYRQQNQVLVPHDQLPATMQETLRGNQYKGWENSQIYQDRQTGEYSFDIRNSNTSSPRTYRFDRNGRLIENANRPNQQGIDQDQ